tara:strand:- start:3554 stop:3925 length:372 start_codon:yes stop_codon:yes gene_type:complete
MPYKDPKDQKAAVRRHYLKNKEEIKARSFKRNKVQRVRNREFVMSIKEISECIDCGEKNPLVLDFDHVKGDKILAISNMSNKAYCIDTISKEMDKCEVRCANCHRIITEKRRDDKRRTTKPLK